MNPTKTLADQTAAVLRLFGDIDRGEADRLLAMYSPWLRMRETSVDAAEELRSLVLDRFPGEPPAVPGVDFLPADLVEAAVRDRAQIVAAVMADPTNWSLYGHCLKCDAPTGEACCYTIRPLIGKLREVPHGIRKLIEVLPTPEVLTGEFTSAREECADPDCHNFGGLPEVCGTGPLFDEPTGWENDFHICPTCRKPRANSWTTHCDTCDGPQQVVSGDAEAVDRG